MEYGAKPAEYIAVVVGDSCVFMSNILNELCHYVSHMFMDATCAVRR